MNNLQAYLPILIPLLILQLTLAVFALISVLRSKSFKTGSKLMWIPIVCFISLIGPILYFTLGKADSE